MEDFQKDHIKDNVDYLYSNTICSPMLLAILRKSNMLTDAEIEDIDAKPTETRQAKELYKILPRKVGAYESLISALDKQLQTGAANNLKEGRQNAPATQQVTTVTKKGKEKLNNDPEKKVEASNICKVPPTNSKEEDETVKMNAILAEYDDFWDQNPIQVVVQRPAENAGPLEDPYNLRSCEVKGIALLVNIKYFDNDDGGDDDDLTRHGSEYDPEYLIQLLTTFRYTIYKKDAISSRGGRWYKKNLEAMIRDFKHACIEDSPKSIIVFIGSHGEQHNIFTSDGPRREIVKGKEETLFESIKLYPDLISKFTDDCETLKGIPKIFFVNACQVYPSVHKEGSRMDPPVSNLLVLIAQVPGFSAYRDPNKGSWLVLCLTFVMMKFAHEKSLDEMLLLVCKMMKNFKKEWGLDKYGNPQPAQRPQIMPNPPELKKFHFFM